MASPLPKTIGRYQVLSEIATGGMASVYLAQDPDIDGHRVAIKVIREGMDDEELLERLAREARAKLIHTNIVRVYGMGRTTTGRPFIVMEFLEGKTLGELIREEAARVQPRLSMARRLGIIEQICRGLHVAHSREIVHRDIKPDNVMVLTDENDLVKILDFGIARLGTSSEAQPAQRPLTKSGFVMGTLSYMAPEQIESKTVDSRADMFAVGAVMYELLSYQKAFSSKNPNDLQDLGRKILYSSPESLATLVPNIDPGLVAIVERCLEKDREKRYPNLDVVRREIEAVRQRVALEEQRRFQIALARAQRDLTAVLLDSASQAIDEAIVIDSTNPDALALRQRIDAAIAERQQAEQETRARRMIGEAKQLFESGHVDEAIRKLEAIQPMLPSVSEALAALRAEAERRARERIELERLERDRLERERFERERRAAEERRRQEALLAEQERRRREKEQAARQVVLNARLGELEYHVAAREWDLAQRVWETTAAIEPDDARLAALRARLDSGRAAARAEATRKAQAAAQTIFLPSSPVLGQQGRGDGDDDREEEPPLESPPSGAVPATPTWFATVFAGAPPRWVAGIATVLLLVGLVLGWQLPAWIIAGDDPVVARVEPDDAVNVPAAEPAAPPDPGGPAASDPTTSRGAVEAVAQPEPRVIKEPRASAGQGLPQLEPLTAPRENPPASVRFFGTPVTRVPALPPEIRPTAQAVQEAEAERAAQAAQALTEASRAEAEGKYAEALQSYESVRRLDPSMAAFVDQQVARVRAAMESQATTTLQRARQLDAVDQVDRAVAAYEDVLRLLPSDSAKRGEVEARLKDLKARR